MYTDPFCRCYRRPSKRSIALWLYLYHGGISKYFFTRLDARRSFAGCCYLFLICHDSKTTYNPTKKQMVILSIRLPMGQTGRALFTISHFYALQPKKKKKRTFLRTFPDALSFRSLLFHPTSLLPYESWPFGYFFAVCRYKGEESEMENMLFGRMIIVIKKLRERWWKSVSLPWVGGFRCCYPIGISCPRAVLTGWLFFVARD